MTNHRLPNTYRGILLALRVAIAMIIGCGNGPGPASSPSPSKIVAPPADRNTACPEYAPHAGPFPSVTPEHRTVAYWKQQTEETGDRILMSARSIERHNLIIAQNRQQLNAPWDLTTPLSTQEIHRRLSERIRNARQRHQRVTYVDENLVPVDHSCMATLSATPPSLLEQTTTIRYATTDIQIRCLPCPMAFFEQDSAGKYDKNACSRIRKGSPVQPLAPWTNGMQLVRTPYVMGWISDSAPLAAIPPSFASMPQALTRNALLEAAFEHLGAPYGWGGQDGGVDCSRYIMDLLQRFGIHLPRASGWQAQAGSWWVDLPDTLTAKQKLPVLDAAHKQGVVLLYFPGHIMLYLGRDEQGVPMAIHALGEYAQPCPNGKETVRFTKQVVITDLDLGADSSRRSFIERLSRIVVFSQDIPPALASIAHQQPPLFPNSPDTCHSSREHRLFRSPRRAQTGREMRIIGTTAEHPGHVRMQVWAPDGTPLFPETKTLGGPPFSHIVRFTPDTPGTWRVALGNGDQIAACTTVRVSKWRPPFTPPPPEDPYWDVRWKWEIDTENYFATFVAHLFDAPLSSDISWNGLGELLRDPKRNLLYNHLGYNEDVDIALQPDCADLPYALRAYFAWKNRLPFAVRSCSRGKQGIPPSCGDIHTNLLANERPEDERHLPHGVFTHFAQVVVAWNAHSSSPRTQPQDENSDFYPVSLSRDALTPGTVFADPYGHILLLTRWFPQTPWDSGVLMAIDGQPDGTIGRRRFWRGSFLFLPDTDDFGAGFKKFRPLVLERPPASSETTPSEHRGDIIPLTNQQLRDHRDFAAFSLDQYKGDTDAFYYTVETRINPRALSPVAYLDARIDALWEEVQRRVQAVTNGEDYMAGTTTPMEMPDGADIFLTTGPWEDYSTPSRDMRLLIAIDTVLTVPQRIREAPERFGATAKTATALAKQMEGHLDTRLAQKTITYRRSDNSEWTLSLSQVVSRVDALEHAYNPNDCPEIRWGAPAASREATTCNRRAPALQRQKMEDYRHWFRTRTRPLH